MKPAARIVASLVLFAPLAVACIGGGDGASSTPPPPASTTSSPTAVGPGTNAKGDYVYDHFGVTATLHLSGTTGTLEIVNKTGITLGRPGFYLLDARDGHRVDGTVDGATDTTAGATATFDVSFTGLEVKDIGMAVLTMGDENFGALAPR